MFLTIDFEDKIFSGETFQMKSFKHCFQMVL